MNPSPIVPAAWRMDESDSVVHSLTFDDRYHPAAGALLQARHVFLAGNGLPGRWQGRDRFVVLETGFGMGNNFLATWDAWRADAQRCRQLHFISIERHPFTRADLTRLHRTSPLQPLTNLLIQAWPPLTPDLHRLAFEAGGVVLWLALGDVSAWLPELSAEVDAFCLDGFAPALNPAMWEPRVYKALARLAAPGATVATWTAAQAVRGGLQAAGFDTRLAQGVGGKRDITLARFEPRFVKRPTARADARRRTTMATAGAEPHALIVGAGLAGCAAAAALAEQGWTATLLDRHDAPAQEGSGNPGGLFHGIFNRQDGAHARFNRAAALQAQRAIADAIRHHGVPGSTAGLLRLQPAADVAALRQQLARSGLPAEYLQAVSAQQASVLSGLPLPHAGWLYPGGGWVDPAAYAAALLSSAGAKARFCGGAEVERIERSPAGWQALDREGRVLAAAPVLVLANAGDALRLLGRPAWPVQAVRGQISLCSVGVGAPRPAVPLGGAGYLLPASGSRLVFGATSQPQDSDASVREADHRLNLAQLGRLTGWDVSKLCVEELEGRTAWRWVSRDRLPIVGPVPEMPEVASSGLPPGQRPDRADLVPRVPGLFVFTALGSRGITWSALGAQVLASCITGAPQAMQSGLLDAVDPARFLIRSLRRPPVTA